MHFEIPDHPQGMQVTLLYQTTSKIIHHRRVKIFPEKNSSHPPRLKPHFISCCFPPLLLRVHQPCLHYPFHSSIDPAAGGRAREVIELWLRSNRIQ